MRFRLVLAGLGLSLLAVLGWGSAAFAQETEEEEHPFATHEAEECFELLEEGGEVDDCQEAPSPIAPATDELIWGAISFTVLFVLLWKVGYPPVKRAMEQRSERIRESLSQAEQAKTEAQNVLEEYQRQLADARNESARIIEEARQTADALRRDLQQRAEAEITQTRQRASEDIEAAKQRAVAELRAEVAELAIGAAERVVERSLDRETNQALVESFISRVGQRNGG